MRVRGGRAAPTVSLTMEVGPVTNPLNASGDPRLPGRSVRRPSVDSATDALLADLFIHATNCVRAFGDFHLAVSAGEEIEPALMRLMYDPGFREFPWTRTIRDAAGRGWSKRSSPARAFPTRSSCR